MIHPRLVVCPFPPHCYALDGISGTFSAIISSGIRPTSLPESLLVCAGERQRKMPRQAALAHRGLWPFSFCRSRHETVVPVVARFRPFRLIWGVEAAGEAFESSGGATVAQEATR